MSGKPIELFCSKEYCFLSWLKSQEQKTACGSVINFSQEEIATEYGISPATVNKWLQALQVVHCVEQKKRGSYLITKTGNAVIAQMNKIEEIAGGKKNG